MKVSTSFSSWVYSIAAVTLLSGGGRGVSHAFTSRTTRTTGPHLTTTTQYPLVRLQATLSVSGDSSGSGEQPQDKTTLSSSTSTSNPLAEEPPKLEDTHTKAVVVVNNATNNSHKKKTWKELRQEGGFFTINTPIGALNPFALYYGLLSLALGLPWLVSLKMCQFLYWITRGRFDQKRRLPVFFSQVWGVLVLRLSRSYPEIIGLDKLQAFLDHNDAAGTSSRPAMFVANHCSWMDIPFLGATVGWRNYKLVSKKELGRVPILGSAIQIGGNIMVDRTDRRSQLRTLKQGINYLKKEGIHLCTFPEGTRSRTGRLLPFKNGAFKMAHKAGAPIIPISICGSHKVMPTGWMFSMKPSHGTAQVIVHDPIESEGNTEDELAAAVRASLISGLPADQQPLLN